MAQAYGTSRPPVISITCHNNSRLLKLEPCMRMFNAWTGLRGNDMQTRPKVRIQTTLEKTTTIGNHDEDRDKGKKLTIELSEQLEGLRVVAELDGTGRIGCKTDPHTAIISCALKTLHPQIAIRQRRKPWYSLFSYKKG